MLAAVARLRPAARDVVDALVDGVDRVVAGAAEQGRSTPLPPVIASSPLEALDDVGAVVADSVSFLALPWRFSMAASVSFSPGAPAPVAAPPAARPRRRWPHRSRDCRR